MGVTGFEYQAWMIRFESNVKINFSTVAPAHQKRNYILLEFLLSFHCNVVMPRIRYALLVRDNTAYLHSF